MTAIRLDLQEEPPLSERFDLIVSGMAMHHIPQTDRVLRAFQEMLLPGGTLCVADLDTEPGTFHTPEAAGFVHHHGFDREKLKQEMGDAGFTAMRDMTVVTIEKPVEGQANQEFSIFLIIAKKSGGP